MTRRLVVLVALLLAVASPASAIKLSFYHQVLLREDSDLSGDPTCGDQLGVYVVFVDEDGMGNRSDFTDLVVEMPLPQGVSVVPGSFILTPGQDSDCHLASGNSPGDRAIRVECPFLCSSGLPNCSQNGGTVFGVVQIDDPNSTTSASFQASFDSNELGPVLSYDLNAGSGSGATVISYPACPATAPPSLYAWKDDSLVADADGDGHADPGDVVRYEVEVRDTGELARDVRFESDAPAHGQLVVGSVTTGFGSAVVTGNNPGDSRVVVDLGTLDPSFPKTVRFDVALDAAIPPSVGQIACQGTVTASNASSVQTDDPATGPGPDPTVTPLDFDPDLVVSKTVQPTTAAPGEALTWSLGFANVGTAVAGGVVLTETVPEYTAFEAAGSTPGWSCADGSPAGTSCTFPVGDLPPAGADAVDFRVRIDAALPAGAEATVNQVTAADDGAAGPDTDPSDNSASATAQLDAAPALRVMKTGPPSVRPGEIAVYTLEYSNDGNQAATGVRLVETVPAATSFVASASTPGWSCADGAPAGTECVLSRGTVPAGAGGTVVFAVEVAAPVAAGVEVVRNAVLLTRDDGDDPPGGPPPGDDEETPVVAAPDLGVVKDGPGTARPGEVIVFTIAYANLGDQDATGVELQETVPAPGVFDAAASTAGWSCADAAPAGTACTFPLGDLAGDDGGTVTFAVRLPATLPAGAERLVNRVRIVDDGAGGADPTPADNTDDAETALDAAPDLRVAKSDGDAVVARGEVVAYSLEVDNAGDQDAVSVSLTDTLPAHTTVEPAQSTPGWSCTVGPPAECAFVFPSLAAGAAAPGVTLALRVSADTPEAATELVNNAAVADDGRSGPDRDPGDNQATETTPLLPPNEPPPPPPDRATLVATLADAVLADADGDGLPAAGDVVTYTALVRNLGPAVARGAQLVVEPDGHTALLTDSPTTTQGHFESGDQPGDSVLAVALGDLGAGASATVTFEVEVATDLPPGLRRIVAQGDLTAGNASATVTDDPDTQESLDPTVTPLDQDGDGEIAEVPTLSALGLGVFILGLTMLALVRLRRRYAATGGWA